MDERGQLTEDAAIKGHALLAYLDGLTVLKPTILVYPIPEVGWLPARINLVARTTGHPAPETISTSRARMEERNAPAVQLLDAVRNANVGRVYPEALFCNTVIKTRCIVQEGGRLYYSDENHLSMEGARLVVAQVVSQLGITASTNH